MTESELWINKLKDKNNSLCDAFTSRMVLMNGKHIIQCIGILIVD